MDSLPNGTEFTVGIVLEWFHEQHPESKQISKDSLIPGIRNGLDVLCGKKVIHLHSPGAGRRPGIYRKGLPVALATTQRAERMIAIQRNEQAARAAAVELAYLETWGEHSPKSAEVLRLVVEAGKS